MSVAIIGAGPQGLAAAAQLIERGLDPIVYELGDRPASAVAEWREVRLFSTWSEVIDPAAARTLERTGWQRPSDGYPTGGEWIDDYLEPLAAALGDRVRLGVRVAGVAKAGRDLVIDRGRAEQPYAVHLRHADGREERVIVDAVIDASGTWRSPNPLGADGIAVPGERAARELGVIDHRPLAADVAQRLAGTHVVIVGSGHSATTAIGVMAEVARSRTDTDVTWVMRREAVGYAFGGGDADELAERGALGLRARRAVESGLVKLVTGFAIDAVERTGEQVALISDDGRRIDPASRVVAATGFRPDLESLSELRLDLDLRLQAPSKLAAEVDPNRHSCGSVRATGAADLAHPDADFFIVGAKSYGRAPTFLAMTGYEQVRSVAAWLAGDREAAARVELVLPETGVCGGTGLPDA